MPNNIPFLGPIDLTGNELQNARLHNLTSAPPAGSGLIYYDTSTGLIGVSNGTTWTYLAKADGALDPNQVHDIVAGMLSGSTEIVSTYNSNTGAVVLTIGSGVVKDANIASDAAISADKISPGSTNSVFTKADESKLDAIAVGATANQTDAYLLNRANHTGSQPSSTISDFTSAVAAIAESAVAGVVDAAPDALDTLKELAQALGDDPDFAGTVMSQLALKANDADLATVAKSGAYQDLVGLPFYVQSVGDNTSTDITVTHNLNSTNVAVTVRQGAAPYSMVLCPNDVVNSNAIVLHFGDAPTTGQYVVSVQAFIPNGTGAI